MKKIITLYCLITIGVSACNKLHFEGNTFQTVKGVITDTLNQPIANLSLNMMAALTRSTYDLNPQSGPVVISRTTTNSDGSFQFTFPRSNGYLYIQLPNTYIVADSINKFPDLHQQIYVDTAKFQNLLYNTQTVKVRLP
ncbi:MAG: hypothetical protein DI598_01980 [Pseudopedobacter saltans]|uniref:Carboxypeptidase regulatory-like domain-containing protein n=1 Tax=Pseudopedobacter saltans TaxID=151895 RepID=A0A2W5H942_9SPHI|nr:MAG: hypothetical protein DI598_01980 [Pseudopedobacter saltans]